MARAVRPSAGATTTARCRDRAIRLKWRKLRRFPTDPPFLRQNLRAGLAAGASLEVDIRALADGRFVCLHDEILESETTGYGPVAVATADVIAGLRMRESGEPPLLLDELVQIARAGPIHPRASLQLDLGPVDAAPHTALAAACDGHAQLFVLSGYDWHVVSRLGGHLRGLALGYDPMEDATHDMTDIYQLVREAAPQADWVYLRRDLVRASQARGDRLVARLRADGHRVDCWTIDPGTSGDTADFVAAATAGCDQITTNAPALWAEANLDSTGAAPDVLDANG